ncbi:MAG TPA: hypothetical protein VMU16_07925 [Candidatus Binataceae bacterium]|nr:hypothetical protein [Candidatus Binataceae bacterium]
MLRFALRHFTAIAIVAAIAAWALFYLPDTPSWMVFQLKRAIDARNGPAAAQYVDFESVARHAGHEIVQKQGRGGLLGEFLGNAAVDIFNKPMANMVQSWTVQKVSDGAREVQMPREAVAGALVVMHHDGDTAYTKFKDSKGREWEIHMMREDDGHWRITEVDNIYQLIEQLKESSGARFGSP